MANNIGEVTVREIDWAAVDKREPGSLDKVVASWITDKKKGEWSEAMCYSPCNEYLAVGSHDNFIYIYLAKKKYKLFKKKMTGHSSFITALDWSQDSDWMRSTCGAHELLFWQPKNNKRDPSGASNTRPVTWADHSAKIGWCVEGITPSGCDGTHINSVTLS